MTIQVRASEVQEMFGSIAPRYDITNTVLSGGIHHLWKNLVARSVPHCDRGLDLCTGTGDLLPKLSSKWKSVVGADFCYPMLKVANDRGFNKDNFTLYQADALSLPFRDKSFGAVTVAFGIRNLENLEKGLAEIHRVLTKNGTLVILEFGQPSNAAWGSVYNTYSKYVMPIIGSVLTGNRSAYEYLPETAKEFPSGNKFKEILEKVGYTSVKVKSLTGGIAYLYTAIASSSKE